MKTKILSVLKYAPSSDAADVEVRYSPMDTNLVRHAPLNQRSEVELIYVEEGVAKQSIDLCCIETRPGNVFFVSPDSSRSLGETSRQATWSVRFPLSAVDGYMRSTLTALVINVVRSHCYTVPEADRSRWQERFRYMRHELRSKRERDNGAVRAILHAIVHDVAGLAQLDTDEKLGRHELLATVFRFIDGCYHRPIGLRDVAHAVQLSPAYLTDLVHRWTGKPVYQWITDRRMHAARNLLATTDTPIATIADRVGFSDAGYFSRQFQKMMGRTPHVWRSACRRMDGVADGSGASWHIINDTDVQYRKILQLGDELTDIHEVDSIVRHSVTTVFNVFAPAIAQFVERKADDQRWYPLFQKNAVEIDVDLPVANDLDGVLPLVLTGQTIVSQDLIHSQSALLHQFGQLGFTCLMVTPVQREKQCVGAIRVLERVRREFVEHDRLMLAMIGNLTALALRGLRGPLSSAFATSSAISTQI